MRGRDKIPPIRETQTPSDEQTKPRGRPPKTRC